MGNQIKKIVNWIGRALMLLAFIFLARKLWTYRESLNVKLSAREIVLLCICCLFYIVSVYMCPVIYKMLLGITTQKKIPYVKVANTYCRSNILKYLPGNVMQYVGRNQIAVEEELSHGKVALATLMEIGIVLVSAALVAVVFWTNAIEWFWTYVSDYVVLLVVVAVGILAIVFGLFWKKIADSLRDLLTFSSVGKILLLVLYHAVILILNSIIYYAVLGVLDINISQGYYLQGIGIYSFAFVLGYVTPGVPGGIGIREAILLHFFSGFMDEAQVLTGALIVRIISVIGDLLAWIGMAIVMRKRNGGESNEQVDNIDSNIQ